MGRHLCSLLFISASLLLARPASAASSNVPQSAQSITDMAKVSVPFDLYRGYLIVAHGSAGPLKGLNFFVDTGTTLSIFDSRIAKKLHLRDQAPVSVVILGGRAQGKEAVLPSLALGPVRRSDLQVVTMDLSFFSKIFPVRIDGIVGLNVVGEEAFIIDYSARVIRFGPPPTLPVSVPLRLDGGLVTFDAVIDHAPVHLVLDTGAASVVLFDKSVAPGQGLNGDGAAQKPDNIGNFARKAVQLRSVRLGDEEFHERPAILVSNPKQSQLDFDGLISPAALGISRVAVDLRQGVLEFSR